MKNRIKVLIPIAMLLAVGILNSCDRRFKGEIDISGYLYESCSTGQPAVGASVAWGMSGKDVITTTTDNNGYYRLKGDYDFKVRKVTEKTINVAHSTAAFGSKTIAEGMPDKSHLDTAYLRNGTFFQVKITTSGASTNQDTIYVFDYPIDGGNFDVYLRSNFPYRSKIAGPFQSNQILGPFERRIDFPHVGFVHQPYDLILYVNYFRGTEENPRVSIQDTTVFVFGQPNTPCSELRTFEVTID